MTTITSKLRDRDFSPTGIKIKGSWENDRNQDSYELFKSILQEAYQVRDVIIGHHLLHVRVDHRTDGDYQIVQEIPAADTLIFDHDVARKIWGAAWRNALIRLALEPVESRDKLLCEMYHNREDVEYDESGIAA